MDASGHQAVIKSLDMEYNSSILCFGIPVLSKLDSSNDSLVIGHHFFNDKKNRRIGSYMFSYCLENKHYANLPDFTFCTLIVSADYPNSGILPFKFSKMRRNRRNISDVSALIPRYISLYSTEENNCGPIFLKQSINEIKIKYHIGINCDQSDCICKKSLKKSKNNPKCVFLDPNQGIFC